SDKNPKDRCKMRRSIRVLSEGLRYVQGATVEGKREYFYFISHEGRLFLDDTKHKNFTSSYKDVAFLNFFYRMLKKNETERYKGEFPFLSRCGIERNFLRCDDCPLVFTRLRMEGEQPMLRIGESSLEVPFEVRIHPPSLWDVQESMWQPWSLLLGSNGRVYHPSRLDLALLTSKLADQLFPLCKFDENARAIEIDWRGVKYPIEAIKRDIYTVE
ncbi:hypothetical protein PMAYCL1PPCAC_23414, partial [Pristionchus mayeri]